MNVLIDVTTDVVNVISDVINVISDVINVNSDVFNAISVGQIETKGTKTRL